MAINLYTSNRLEILARQCAAIFRAQPLPPLEPEIVVVQSRGMARWLAMEMAGFLTVWANARCLFPNRFVAEIFSRVLPAGEQPAYSGLHGPEATWDYERGRACWQLMALLAELRHEPALRQLAAQLDDPLQRFQLAGQLADLFDQYIIYRPDLISAWENGGEGGWQALLWQRLVSRHGQVHRAALLSGFLQAMREKPPPDLPGRVTLFGISSLPPFHLEVLHALSEHIPVNLFFMNPCRHWWGDILPEREIARRVARQQGEAATLYLESGNPLLASMGHIARDFLVLLQERDCLEQELFEAPAGDSLLASIQRDILELTVTPRAAGMDGSVVIHSCHSPMREVEVLQDRLLALFAGDPSLCASDIIVMAPDIEPYIPLVQAVFGLERDNPRYIPYSLADKGVGADSILIDTFFALLDMAGGRFAARDVIAMLQRPLFAGRFGFSEADCALIKGWVRDAAIRWGRDGSHKQEFGLPPYAENTWRAGLDRLLLGYAMADRAELFAGILPCGRMAESDAGLLGRLLDAVETLFARLARLPGKRRLSQWAAELQALVDDCLLAGQEQENDLAVLRQALQGMTQIEQETSFAEAVELRVVIGWLQRLLQLEKSPHGFLSGGVTFCSLLPMRAIPFQVVCLLGMNDGDFPRPHFTASFDLMSREPRRGDRSPRHDDRYLFLEALLSARRQLSISFVGQSVRDDAALPPSVLVSELLDYLAMVCPAAPEKTDPPPPPARFVIRHRLQPFHPAYFQPDGDLFSYAPENCRAAQRLARGPDPGAGFWRGLPLPAPAEPLREIEFADFVDFFLHPVRYFCRSRLGVELAPLEEESEDNEPFSLTGLPRYQLTDELLDLLVRDAKAESPAGLWKACGLLPHGRVGAVAARELQEEAAGFYRMLAPHLAPPVSPPVFRVAVGDVLLCGTLDRMTERGLLYARPARLKGRDLLRAWLSHLVANLAAMTVPRRTVLVANDTTLVLAPVPDSEEILVQLMDLFRQGRQAPLPFFAETSWNYARWAGQGDPARAWREASAGWRGGHGVSGEGDDVYLRFRYQGDDVEPLDRDFADMAMRIFSPLLARVMVS
jgi:exodeoxyribonuclease V gamma subunit